MAMSKEQANFYQNMFGDADWQKSALRNMIVNEFYKRGVIR